MKNKHHFKSPKRLLKSVRWVVTIFAIISVLIIIISSVMLCSHFHKILSEKEQVLINYQPMQKVFDMGNFDRIILKNGLHATIMASSSLSDEELSEADLSSVDDGLYTIVITGNANDVNNIDVSNNDHVLTLSRRVDLYNPDGQRPNRHGKMQDNYSGSVKIEITAPNLEHIDVE